MIMPGRSTPPRIAVATLVHSRLPLGRVDALRRELRSDDVDHAAHSSQPGMVKVKSPTTEMRPGRRTDLTSSATKFRTLGRVTADSGLRRRRLPAPFRSTAADTFALPVGHCPRAYTISIDMVYTGTGPNFWYSDQQVPPDNGPSRSPTFLPVSRRCPRCRAPRSIQRRRRCRSQRRARARSATTLRFARTRR